MEMMHAKIDQKYEEFLMKLNRFDKHIEENRDQWKISLEDRMESRIGTVLIEQLQKDAIDGSEVNRARDELAHVQKLFDLLNSSPLISVINIEDNQMDLNAPRLVFPSVTV